MESIDVQQASRPQDLSRLESPVERVIVPAKRRLKVSELLREAPVVRVLAARDFKVKYKQSMLGPLWLVFQPLALLVAFLVAFKGLGNVQTSGQPYVVFTLVGLSAWAFFQASMTIGTASLITNASFIRYTPCPRPAFPLASTVASLPSFGVTAAGALAATIIAGDLSPRVVLLPIGLLWLFVLTLGVVALASSLAVRYRDIISALPFLLQVGIFLTPIGYSLPGLSDTVRMIVQLNPLTGLIESLRWMMLSGYSPLQGPLPCRLPPTTILAVAGWLVFSRLETTMADEI